MEGAARSGALARAMPWRDLAVVLGLYALSRAVLIAIGLLALDAGLKNADFSLGPLLCRWDCGWYLDLAAGGYRPVIEGKSNLAFFPVYPLLVRDVAELTGWAMLPAALAVSNLAFVGALWLVLRYAQAMGAPRSAAMAAVALVAFAPQSIVFSAAYTESLFLLLLAGAMLAARREHWLVAGLLAAVLTATRATGVVFLAFAGALVVQRFGWRLLLRPWERPEAFLPLVLAPMGLFLFWGYAFVTYGDAFAPSTSVMHGWGWRMGVPWENLLAHLNGSAATRYWTIGSLLLGAASLLLMPRRAWPELALCAAAFALLWSGTVANSMLRYSIVLFPIWIALAWWCVDRPLRGVVVAASVAGFAGFSMVAWSLGWLVAI